MLMKKYQREGKKIYEGFHKPKERKNENIYLIRENLLPKRNKDICVSLCCKKCVISFPIQYCFFESVNIKEYNFYDKKVWFLFWLTNERKKNIMYEYKKKKNKYERTNVFQMIFSEMRLFVQKIIAFWMTASLVCEC